MTSTSTPTILEVLAAEGSQLTMKDVVGPHDVGHPHRMINLGRELSLILTFDFDEFVASVWLHNWDRVNDKHAAINERGFGTVVREAIQGHFSDEAVERIVDAVVKHSKLDAEGDSPLLTALRSADRLDWLGLVGIIGAGYMWTPNGMYGDPDPFAREVKGVPRNFWQDAMRQTEWYAMLPSDDVRELAASSMEARLRFLRAFAEEVSTRLDVENRCEEELKRVLGEYYDQWEGAN